MKMDELALDYHSKGRPGKIEVISSKTCNTEKDLSLAYSPGVAAPCKEIAKDSEKVFDYTAKGNLVAVISDGTAVLGLGNIGPLAAKPVMEGKGILFKQFAGIDVFDLEIKADNIAHFVDAVKAMEPTFGGINLENIKAPECFEIEERLKSIMQIPVFHDDQHGTAIVAGAALLNACHLTNRGLDKIRLVVNGAGAAAIACSKIFVALGVKEENLTMCDTQGVIFKGRANGMNKYKEQFALDTANRTLSESLLGADVFVGLSVAGVLTPEMLKGMRPEPIVLAMANPDPEISPTEALKVRPDVIVCTGRSDFPNQVNNVLAFPSIFRGALDVRATEINEMMKLAAVHALAALARETVSERVSERYGGKVFKFGRDYLLPKPFDSRVLQKVAPAVAMAAMASGVAKKEIVDWESYAAQLESIQGPTKTFVRSIIHQIQDQIKGRKRKAPRIVFPEGTNKKILQALNLVIEDQICKPILIGDKVEILRLIDILGLSELRDIEIVEIQHSTNYVKYVTDFHALRERKGVSLEEAGRLMTEPNYFASMMVLNGDADGLVSGVTQNYADSVRPILQTIGVCESQVPFGLNIALLEDRLLFLADTTININPNAEECAQIALQCASVAKYLRVEPQIAMLSYSNFSGQGVTPRKMKLAAERVKALRPDLKVDGDLQADAAVSIEIQQRIFPFCTLSESANVLIFPNLESSNICYKSLQQIGKVEILGPFLMGVRNPSNILQETTNIDAIVNAIVMTAFQVLSENG